MEPDYDLILKLKRLQEANFAHLVRLDELRRQDHLSEADAGSLRLLDSLRMQQHLTNEYNAMQAGLSQVTAPLEFSTAVLLDALLSRADIVESLRRGDEADVLRREALTLAAAVGPSELAKRQRSLAGTLLEKGKVNEALAQLLSAYDLSLASDEKLAAAQCAADLADAFEFLRDFDRALELVNEGYGLLTACGVSVESPDLDAEAVTAKLAARVPRMIVDEHLMRLKPQVNTQAILIQLYQIQARSCIVLHEFDTAKVLFDKVRPAILDYAKPSIDYEYARILVESGRHEAGLAALAQLEPRFRSGVLQRKLGAILRLKAVALMHLGQVREASAAVAAARASLTGYDDPDLEWKVTALQGRIANELREAPLALEAYQRAVTVLDYLRRAPLGFRLDSLNLTNKLPVYREAIAVAAKAGDAVACCRFIELVKSRQLGAVLSLAGGSGTTSPLAREIDDTTEQLVGIDYCADGDTERQALIDKRNKLIERMRVEDPRWRTLTAPVEFSLDAVLASLRSRRQAALTLFYDDDCVTAVLLQGGRARCARAALPPATAQALLGYAANLDLDVGELDETLFDPAAFPGLDFESLIPPELVAPALVARSLLVVPHRISHLLPWAMLPFAGRRLCDFLPVGVLPNLTCLPLMAAEQVSAPRVVTVGSADAGHESIEAAAECEAIARIYAHGEGAPRQPPAHIPATRRAFLQLLGEPQRAGTILHVACHGSFDVRDPLSSAIHLDDGRVDAAALAHARISFDEVVLSACNTGQRALEAGGVQLVGDEILGLVGALIEAGTPSVLVSIPPAADSATRALMMCYHRQRAAGTTPLFALQSAQRTMLSEGLYDPSMWGGFSVFGVS